MFLNCFKIFASPPLLLRIKTASPIRSRTIYVNAVNYCKLTFLPSTGNVRAAILLRRKRERGRERERASGDALLKGSQHKVKNHNGINSNNNVEGAMH